MEGIIRILSFLSLILNGLCFGEPLGLSQDGVSVKLGEDAILECPLPAISREATVSWYKQSPGERPELVLSYKLPNTSHVLYGQGFHHEKFTVQTNGSRLPHRHHLLIRRSMKNDTAVYYCGHTGSLEKNHN
ncbi:hypothetical protein DPEC_G00271080 [Dallia pectoralis]|uniref:Uncharacterized protein n=1 Tax=Dallia pectoralis TaxID=75939 RepID=A0ACC2FPG1_DALPE|nr:hypothetical protein DPEC_G00271080 [Dallia pectoralis]